jgi:hypothetical protein
MTNIKRTPMLSDAEEARIQAGIAADPDNPEWTANDFRRAKADSPNLPGPGEESAFAPLQKQPAKIAVSLRLTRGGGALQVQGTGMAGAHG